MYISRFGEIRTKPGNLKLQWSVGDIVVLANGQHALITGYGIYDGQYWLERYYGDDSIHLAGADYEFSAENTEAVKNRVSCIEKLETDKNIIRKVIKAYCEAIKEQYENNQEFEKAGLMTASGEKWQEQQKGLLKHIEFYKNFIS